MFWLDNIEDLWETFIFPLVHNGNLRLIQDYVIASKYQWF